METASIRMVTTFIHLTRSIQTVVCWLGLPPRLSRLAAHGMLQCVRKPNRARRKERRRDTRIDLRSPFLSTVWRENSHPLHLLKQTQGEGLSQPVKCSRNMVKSLVRKQLQPVQPNPGPRKSEERRKKRRWLALAQRRDWRFVGARRHGGLETYTR